MNPATHPSDFQLEALAFGALTPAERDPAEAHLAGCTRCQDELTRVRQAHLSFTQSVVPRTLPRVLERLGMRSGWQSRLRWALMPALAACAVLVAALVLRTGPGDSRFGVKGGGAFQVFGRHAGKVFHVTDGARLIPGDEIRFVLEPGGLPYVLVVSVDGAGQPNVYFPFDGRESAALEQKPRVELPNSLQLDAALGPERLFALFSRQPLVAAQVTDALRALGQEGAQAIRARQTLPVSADSQASIWFEKVAP